MQVEGKIAVAGASIFAPWNPVGILRRLSVNDVYFGSGFLRAKISKLFPGLEQHWGPFFTSLGVDIRIRSISQELEFPDKVGKVFPLEVAGETGIMGCLPESVDVIAKELVPEVSQVGVGVAFEYICRRFFSTLSLSWSGDRQYKCRYLSFEQASRVEVVGVVAIEIEIANKTHNFWIGLGPKTTKIIDETWKNYYAAEHFVNGQDFPERVEIPLSVELPEMLVRSTDLERYIADGAVIDLGTQKKKSKFNSDIIVKIHGESYARGELCQHENRYAVQILEIFNGKSLDKLSNAQDEDMTSIRTEIFNFFTDAEEIRQICQPGGVILSEIPVTTPVSLVIEGDIVARAALGTINDSIAMKVSSDTP